MGGTDLPVLEHDDVVTADDGAQPVLYIEGKKRVDGWVDESRCRHDRPYVY